jgi:hypothetical protein
MWNKIYVLLAIFLILHFWNCSNKKPVENSEIIKSDQLVCTKDTTFVDTDLEIKVYNDIIDEVFRIFDCRDLATPENYRKRNPNATKGEYEAYDEYYAKILEMLDTLKITTFVPDSLKRLNLNNLSSSRLDSNFLNQFHEFFTDTTILEPEFFNIDSLKSKKIYFERVPSRITRLMSIDPDNYPHDSLKVFDKEVEKFWFSRFGNRIGNKYYTGEITMSRVKFNSDSTLCVLEYGYSGGHMCGSGHYYYLRKINSKWKIVNKTDSWIV